MLGRPPSEAETIATSTMDEVPIESRDAAGSLPTPDEIHTMVVPTRTSSVASDRARCRKLGIIACVVIVTILFISLIVGATRSSSPGRNANIDDVTAFLETEGIFLKEATPQYEAALWLANDDVANLAVPQEASTDTQAYEYLVRYVMAINFLAMGGENWVKDFDFMSGKGVCQWNGIVFDGNQPFQAGLWCTDDDLPERLYLDYNNLDGSIPTENGLLTTLRVWDTKVNSVSGSIPTELCQLQNLEIFAVGYNDMTGIVPSCLSLWTRLRILYLGNNEFSGPFPSSVSSLQSLTRILIDDNSLSGDINMFSGLPNLELLYIEDNSFFGDLTDNFLATSMKLEAMDLSSNDITSSSTLAWAIPAHLFNHPNLTIMDMSNNRIAGPLPTGFIENDVLEFVSLHNNDISGPIPSNLERLANLTHLDLSSNSFDGPIPDSLGNLVKLEYLFLSDNIGLTPGNIPDTFSQLVNMEELSLKRTKRLGALPDWIGTSWGQDSKLILLDLDDNGFTGPIPDSWGALTTLQFLLLNRNQIDGNLPSTFSQLTRLRAVFLDGTSMTGDLDVLCAMDNFREANGAELIMANCNKLDCTCTACQCCNDDEACSDPLVTNLDLIWEAQFGRVVYTFGNRSAWV